MIQALTEATVACGVEVSDWQDAVRAAGELLVNAGHVEKRYIEAMIETVKELGPYIVIAPGIALPHARPEEGVISNGMCIITLKNPVEFGSHNDPVRVVIAFGAVEVESHLKALKELANVLKDKYKCCLMRKAVKKGQILDLFEEMTE
jgi:mannitol operon transcriptional antiterminator